MRAFLAYLEVLDAQRVHNEASLNVVQAKQATFLATVELFKVLGGDWKSESSASQPPQAN